MYMDAVVFAGLATVVLILGFFGGVGYFIYKDSNKQAKEKH